MLAVPFNNSTDHRCDTVPKFGLIVTDDEPHEEIGRFA